jgi:signal transduction histidine kinase
VIAEREPVVIDVDVYPVHNPILRQKGIKSMLGVPLLVRGEGIGVLHVGALVPRVFTEEEVELLQLVAERVAIAIERARLHEETVQLDQLKLNFVAIASHELRTPAASVYGALATLVGRGEELPRAMREELLRVGYEQADRLRRLLEELLDLSRLDARSVAVEPRPLVLHALLDEIVASAVPDDAGVQLKVAPDLAAFADPMVIDRVVTNLLVNAARYGAEPIVVAAEQRDRYLRISVEDAGPGVPAPLLPRLFERFARGDEAAGSGLGLAIARSYARAHGGDLVYDPRGAGARFELFVPQQTAAQQTRAIRPSPTS